MKKFYDKLLLLLAFLALIGGVTVYVQKSDAGSVSGSDDAFQIADNPYKPIQVPKSEVKDATWPFPGEQSTGWVYDVFTPPKIYIAKDGTFSIEPIIERAVPIDPFGGLYLATAEQIPYRVQLQGFSGDRTKPEECVLFMFDEEREMRFFIRVGQSDEEADIKVLDFEIDREIDENNVVDLTVTATILDQRVDKEVKLVDGETLYLDEIQLVFRSDENPDLNIERVVDLENPELSLETEAGQFTLTEINLEEMTVTVEKQTSEDEESAIRTFSPRIDKSQDKTESEESDEDDNEKTTEETELDLFFQ